MNKRVLILHGLGGSDYPHWQAHLARDLIQENMAVSLPHFPNRDNPTLLQWKQSLKEEIAHFNPTIVVCHSLANLLWFHSCDELNVNLDKLLLVAPVRDELLEDAKTFFPYPIPKSLKAKEVLMIASTNDPYMYLSEANDLQQQLNVEMRVLEDAGHINASSGFGKLECALEWINNEEETE